MKRTKWDQRIKRAENLAVTHPFAAEVLRFYKHVAASQKILYLQFEGTAATIGILRVQIMGRSREGKADT